jgi:hypothetical protein
MLAQILELAARSEARDRVGWWLRPRQHRRRALPMGFANAGRARCRLPPAQNTGFVFEADLRIPPQVLLADLPARLP